MPAAVDKRTIVRRQEITDPHYFSDQELRWLAQGLRFQVIDADALCLLRRLPRKWISRPEMARLRSRLGLCCALRSCSLFSNTYRLMLVKPGGKA